MATFHYLDFEMSLAAEGWTVTQTGDGTAVRGSTGWPDRGDQALRATGGSIAANIAYAAKGTLGVTVDENSSVFVGQWIKNAANPAAITSITTIKRDGVLNGLVDIAEIQIFTDGTLKLFYSPDNAVTVTSAATSLALTATQWHWVVLEIFRATTSGAGDGFMKVYIDGHLRLTTPNFDNFNRADTIDELWTGITKLAQSGHIVDSDEIKIADAYTEPTVATPATENPEAARTVVLYREASADSKEFADYCVTQLGIPIGMLCPLPNASANEIRANYAAFQAEVETDLIAWLALNPIIAAQTTVFLVGYDVPGGFVENVLNHSTTSRLMVLGQTFSSGTENSLYQTTDRLTRASMGSNAYMALRIDADTLANAKAVVDASLVVDALSELPDAAKLYSDETAYLATAASQFQRMVIDDIGTFANDAFVFGDAGGAPSYGAAGSRATFVHTDNSGTAVTLRNAAGSVCAGALITNGYASILGRQSTPTDDRFDPATFFEVLRKGYTFAEASRACVKKTNYVSEFAGSPLMTVAFQTDGYNLYRGGPDFGYDTVVAYFRRGVATGTTTFLPEASTTYKYSLRPVYQGIETPNVNVVADFDVGSDSDWVGNRPEPVTNVLLSQDSGGVIKIEWRYLTGAAAAASFDIWHDPDVPPDGSAGVDQNVTWTSDGPYAQNFTLTDGLPFFFRIIAKTSGGIESNAVIAGPLLADSTAPAVPTLLNAQTF